MGGTVSAAELLADLARRGIRLEADGERLRYHPRSALTPDLLDRLKAHKAELLTLLLRATAFDIDSAPDAEPAPAAQENPAPPACRCGSTIWRDVPIHDGQSARRDCGRCGRFINFPIWYGRGTLQNET